jgi:hypothetical protein
LLNDKRLLEVNENVSGESLKYKWAGKKCRTYSRMVEAATVIAVEADAGEYVQAFFPPFPAATTTGIPALVASSTAALRSIAFRSVPRDKFTTIGILGSFCFRSITYSNAAIMSLNLDVPSLPKTFRATSFTSFATPYVLPPDHSMFLDFQQKTFVSMISLIQNL